ncbi:hypothetical protein JRO89_XS11G0066000 [Xanthoceras sorbifolium]|uniref:FAD-binding PCMH-type domain-containing protein n=1 Tax=Xanthoceras sorbifolium TaxID=99658 RepID=A0ABQ8HF04_9ROSI|nr:hypothetical protein JRO89_XS11G0066000 [Xanthoceras sorbifolium]
MQRSLFLKRTLQSLNYRLNLINNHPSFSIRTLSSSTSSSSSTDAELRKYVGYTALLAFCGAATYYSFPFSENAKHKKAQIFRYAPLPEDLHTVSNWSGTHEVQTRNFHQPETILDLEKLVKDSNAQRAKIRPVGSGLSPNGIGLARAGMVNLALLDKVLEVDKEKKTVRVQAGIRVQQLVDEIKEYGITLQNFASIREQQIGGILQVGAHGTGAKLPPIDEQVISMKLVTPAKGTIELSKEKDPELFYLARCGLGALEWKLLSENKHVKYLYIPYTDSVVVVRCNPVSKWKGPPKFKPKYTEDEAIQHVRDLYRECLTKYRADEITVKSPDNNETDINELSFTELRDKLLSLDPLNKDHVIKVNQAEAEFWRKSEGYRVGWADEILGFDCGGQQWVSETCFPAGTFTKPSIKDIEYIEELKKLIEKEKVPAPAPIEQRWTARSQSPMSPAYSSAEDDIFS